MTDTTDEKLQLHIEALENLLEEKKGISDDIKDRYAMVKADGYDKKVVQAVIKRRAIERQAVNEFDQLVTTYESALGIA